MLSTASNAPPGNCSALAHGKAEFLVRKAGRHDLIIKPHRECDVERIRYVTETASQTARDLEKLAASQPALAQCLDSLPVELHLVWLADAGRAGDIVAQRGVAPVERRNSKVLRL